MTHHMRTDVGHSAGRLLKALVTICASRTTYERALERSTNRICAACRHNAVS
jgi:hypothetical protein